MIGWGTKDVKKWHSRHLNGYPQMVIFKWIFHKKGHFKNAGKTG